MQNFFVKLLLRSVGMKRNIASLLAALLVVAPSIPVLVPYLSVIQYLAGLFGAVGLGMAAVNGNLTIK